MIEKINWDEQPEDAAKEVQNLIDQLVDAVNVLIKENNIHEKQIDELQMKVEPEKCETPAENGQPDYVTTTYMTNGHIKEYYGQNGASIVTDHPLPAGYVITIKESETRTENVQPDAESRPENVQDKFAEQRKWVGKLCKFWDIDNDNLYYGPLTKIHDTSPYCYECNHKMCYANCEPVKDDIMYKGGSNDSPAN